MPIWAACGQENPEVARFFRASQHRAPPISAEAVLTFFRTGHTELWLELCEKSSRRRLHVGVEAHVRGRADDAVEIYAREAFRAAGATQIVSRPRVSWPRLTS